MFFPTAAKKVSKKYGILMIREQQTSDVQAPPNETLGNPVQKVCASRTEKLVYLHFSEPQPN